jgi:hypothetical protein
MTRYTTSTFIDKAITVHGLKYNYTNTVYIGYKQKLSIICPIHGVFQISPNAHISQKQGCSLCSIISRTILQTKTTSQFIKESIDIHGTIYDYSKTDYKACNKKLIIICKDHGEFMIRPEHHLKKIGCAKCGTKRSSDANRLSQHDFIEKSINIHNGLYNYSNVKYIDNKTNVIIICFIHGEFTQTPNNHLNGNGCGMCGKEYRGLFNRLSHDEFIEKANNIHLYKYDYSNVIYDTRLSIINIICPDHGLFKQLAASHLQGYGCTQCGYIKVAKSLKNTKDEFIEKAQKVHGDKYNYQYGEYINTNKNITIICKIHGSFQQRPHSHISNKSGCPVCANSNHIGRVSKVSLEWLAMINVRCVSLQMEYHIPTTNYYADGYDPVSNTIYEFYGDYWHGNPNIYNETVINERINCTMGKLYENTLRKKNKCLELGYKYIEIWENQWNKFKQFIIKKQRIINNRYSKL